MMQINLLPDTGKKKRRRKIKFDLNLTPFVFTLIATIVAVVAVWVALAVRLYSERNQLSRLDKQLQSKQVTLQKIDELKQDKEELLSKLEFLDQQLKGEVLWARNLNHLSLLVPPGVWLKKVVLHAAKEDQMDKYQSLDIEGSTISLQKEEMMDLIGSFMTALKKDEIFSQQFSEIKLISSKRARAGKIEIMEFKLFCQFREDKVESRK